MGKTIRAIIEERWRSGQVPLSDEEIQGLLGGWLDNPVGTKDIFDFLIVEMGRACRAALDSGKPCDKSTMEQVCLSYIFIICNIFIICIY